jgi:hypothetical protein
MLTAWVMERIAGEVTDRREWRAVTSRMDDYFVEFLCFSDEAVQTDMAERWGSGPRKWVDRQRVC